MACTAAARDISGVESGVGRKRSAILQISRGISITRLRGQSVSQSGQWSVSRLRASEYSWVIRGLVMSASHYRASVTCTEHVYIVR